MMVVRLDRKTRARVTDLLVSGRYSSRDEIFNDDVRLVNLRETELGLLDAGLRYATAAADAGLGNRDETVEQVVASFRG